MVSMLNVTYGKSKASTNALGQREMQARTYAARAAQYLLLKAPPAAGKSRALMFVALDKLRHQGLSKCIVCVPETSIGGSFRSTDLMSYGFEANWQVDDKYNLCLGGDDASQAKVKDFVAFLSSDAEVLICTHATFRFGYDALSEAGNTQLLDNCFIAIDEFHHLSASDNNRLGVILRSLLTRDRCHIMAMTGSYFRGDAAPVLRPEDEERFTKITYSYYEQIEGYDDLKALGINYEFYKGNYINGLKDILDPKQKTIIHIPHRGSSEAFDDKYNEVGKIIDLIGKIVERDAQTGFDIVECHDGSRIRIADLVDDGPSREIVKAAISREIKGADGKRDDDADRAKVDIIIALGMAKEGFDWVWCEHALTIGYRSSLTEIVQIIGRATRDAPGKAKAMFTNLVAEPGVETGVVTHAVNDMLKAISGSLLMEQVLAPNFKFYRREDDDIREKISTDDAGNVVIGIKGLIEPPSQRAKDICEQDMHDLIAATCQEMDRRAIAPETLPEVVTQLVMTEIIERKYEHLTEDETEAVRQQLSAQMNIITLVRKEAERGFGEAAQAMLSGSPLGQGAGSKAASAEEVSSDDEELTSAPNALLRMVKKFINVRDIDIELIDSVNAFRERFEVASKSLDAKILANVQSAMVACRTSITEAESLLLWPRIKAFRAQEGREPNPHSQDALEQRMAEALAWIKNQKAKKSREAAL